MSVSSIAMFMLFCCKSNDGLLQAVTKMWSEAGAMSCAALAKHSCFSLIDHPC